MNQQQREVVNTLKEYIPNLTKGVLDVIDKINKNKLNETIKMTSDIMEGLEWVNDALALTIANDQVIVNKTDITKIINDIYISYKNEDSILAKDILKYELLPLLEYVNKAFEQC